MINKKLKDSIARSKDIPSSANLPGNGARKELDVYNLLLVDVVGPPSAEICRIVANFPQVDDLRFINPWEV